MQRGHTGVHRDQRRLRLRLGMPVDHADALRRDLRGYHQQHQQLRRVRQCVHDTRNARTADLRQQRLQLHMQCRVQPV